MDCNNANIQVIDNKLRQIKIAGIKAQILELEDKQNHLLANIRYSRKPIASGNLYLFCVLESIELLQLLIKLENS